MTIEQIAAAMDQFGVADLRQVVAVAEAKIQEKSESEKRSFIEETLNKAKALGLSIRDLFGETPEPAKKRGRGKAKPKPEGSKVAPKYRGPAGQEWSGRGRKPIWARGMPAEQLEQHLIEKPAAE
ncbi:H-NS family nucleoid-associated regulatory protein [Belnapia sp. F-4-1]|uniref:H-NS histone family protein n=1 Tax=Belnapia sp. F-4-1 TaxID=1545443 RepID=UPI000689D246|nr:H-NS histone family protein [Belnapia sp. F-4-1]